VKPKAIVTDIDDTLDVYGGQANPRVITYLRRAYAQGTKVIVLTARTAVRQPQTIRWLAYWHVPFHRLIMRPLGSVKWGPAFKAEAYRRQIAPQFDVTLAIDNLTEPWVSLGVPLWHVETGSNNAAIAKKFARAMR
jgi:hypothetical protein